MVLRADLLLKVCLNIGKTEKSELRKSVNGVKMNLKSDLLKQKESIALKNVIGEVKCLKFIRGRDEN